MSALVALLLGCEPSGVLGPDPASPSPTSSASVQTLGPSTPTPAIAQALANGQPIDIDQRDPSGAWRYAVKSQGKGDLQVSFQLGQGQGATGTAGNLHQQVKDHVAATRARHAQRRQAHQQRLAAMKARAAQAPSTLPLKASFNIHIDGNFDAEALKAQLAKLQHAAQAQQGAGGQKLTWTLGSQPQGTHQVTPAAPSAPSAAPQVVSVPVPVAVGTASAVPQPAPAAVAPVQIVDDAARDAVEETAELYLWLGSTGELDEARELVVEDCHDGPVGQVAAVTFLDDPLELTESQVTATRLRTGAATVSYDLTGTLTRRGDGDEVLASAVNLTGELSLVHTDEGWLVSCP
ncbi:MAG: hypothetical protein QF464_03565 [Myxococcota bacterium]|nr:hypothetical protein [Myxococcota bacterium]